jgi:hypothetical protein
MWLNSKVIDLTLPSVLGFLEASRNMPRAVLKGTPPPHVDVTTSCNLNPVVFTIVHKHSHKLKVTDTSTIGFDLSTYASLRVERLHTLELAVLEQFTLSLNISLCKPPRYIGK